MSSRRILRGVRVATVDGIQPASVHIHDGRIAAVAAYDDLPREARPEELGKSVLMAGLIVAVDGGELATLSARATLGGITTLLLRDAPGIGEELAVDWALAKRAERAPSAPLEQLLSSRWTELRDRNRPIEELAALLCEDAAEQSGLAARKGRIAAGLDADFVIWNPELCASKAGEPLRYGLIRQTILGGRTIARDGMLASTGAAL